MSVGGPKIKLNNGLEIPAIGLGTWQSKPDEVINAVEYALKHGYRHIDCAWAYGNEKEVGEGIRRSGVPRSEIWITSKVWPTGLHAVETFLDETLANLGVEYLDLYLVHWPIHLNPKGNHPSFPTKPDGSRDIIHDWPLSKTWEQMEAVLEKGKVRSIGVSNFSEKTLEQILPSAKVVPAVNQIELHLYNPQHELLEYLKAKGIVAQAYSPLGSTNSPLFTDETASEIAKHHNVQTSDILLGYLVAKNIVALPKSVTPARIASNFDGAIAAFNALTPEDVKKLDEVAANGKQKRLITPPWGVDLGFANWPGQTPLRPAL
ncbi:Aldo/keto reductase [Trametopsis cervina]|nr:Aldo/keto reductase [Trametopsis cervina]